MDLSLALDPGAVPAVATDPRWPGSDPNDATSVAFAALLASLMASAATPLPTPLEAVPEPTPPTTDVVAAVGAAEVLPMAFAAPAAIALPAALPAVAVPVADVPVAETEAAPAELAPAVPTPALAVPRSDGDQTLEADADGDSVPPASVSPAPAKPTAVQLPVAVTPVAMAFSSPSLGDATTDGDEKDGPPSLERAAPVTQAAPHAIALPSPTPVREILKPEIVQPAAAPSSPVAQVVKAVVPLHRLADGTHNMVLELHPAELGAVRVEVSLDAGIIHLGLRADVEGTSRLLRAALPELRSQLDAAGITAGRVAVDSGQADRGDGQPTWRTDADGSRQRHGTADDTELVDDVVAPTYSSSAYGQIDVLL